MNVQPHKFDFDSSPGTSPKLRRRAAKSGIANEPIDDYGELLFSERAHACQVGTAFGVALVCILVGFITAIGLDDACVTTSFTRESVGITLAGLSVVAVEHRSFGGPSGLSSSFGRRP